MRGIWSWLAARKFWVAGCFLVVFFFVCGATGVAWALFRPPPPPSGRPPKVEIQAPAPGQMFPVGQPLSVQAMAQSRTSDARVARLMFWVDGRLVSEQTGPANPLIGSWSWTPKETGSYVLVVQAVDTQNRIAAAFRTVRVTGNVDEMDDDADGVPNAKDACPNQPGVVYLDGCPEKGPDRDGDGIPDDQDNCPDQAGLEDQQGCPVVGPGDADGDGISDTEDACPAVPGPVNTEGCPTPPDADGDGIPDSDDPCPNDFAPEGGCPPATDEDGDGVPNEMDACPQQPGPADNGGCPLQDTDGDGIADAQDACPEEAGIEANQGCPVPTDEDGDGDGVIDVEDACPDQPGPPENLGCPWQDTDGDSIPDVEDACPNEAGPPHGDGCPQPDGDGDGVPDEQDACPDLTGPQGNDGCPLTDNDGDGIPNDVDACPEMAGAPEYNGCPNWVFPGDFMDLIVERKPRICDLMPQVCGQMFVQDTDGDGVEDAMDACPTQPGPPLFNGCPWTDDVPSMPDPCDFLFISSWLCDLLGGGPVDFPEPAGPVEIRFKDPAVTTNKAWTLLTCSVRINEGDWILMESDVWSSDGGTSWSIQEEAYRRAQLEETPSFGLRLEMGCWGWRSISEGSVFLGRVDVVIPPDEWGVDDHQVIGSEDGHDGSFFWAHYQVCPQSCP